MAQNTDIATDSQADARLVFAPLPDVAGPDRLKIAYTGTTTPHGPAAFSSYGIESIAVSRDGKYLTVAQRYSEDKQCPVFDAETGQVIGRADGFYVGPACAIGNFGMDDHERRNQTKDADGAPLGGWHPAVLTSRDVTESNGNRLLGVFFGGLAMSDGTTTGGLGAGNSWNEDRPGGESLLVQERPIVDIALCREDSVILFADATPDAPALLLFDRARPFVPDDGLNFEWWRANTLMRFNRSIPLPAVPLRVSAMPDGSAAWVILDTEPRQAVKVSLQG